MAKDVVFLSGLPRSGSTLISNLLDLHPDIYSTPSSPLYTILHKMRHAWSDDPFLLAQLDSNFDGVYERLERSVKAFVEAWSSDKDTPMTVDKSRGWLCCVELLKSLYPDYKMIVCLRDLRNVFASIEKQHRKTLLLDFPDHMDPNIVDGRAFKLFEHPGVIGSPLKALYNLDDVPDMMSHLFFLRYEDFLRAPQETMDMLLKWLDIDTIEIDFDNIPQSTMESDSHYRFKYPHKIKTSFTKPESLEEIKISPRILKTIVKRFRWFYYKYYKDMLPEELKGQKEPGKEQDGMVFSKFVHPQQPESEK